MNVLSHCSPAIPRGHYKHKDAETQGKQKVDGQYSIADGQNFSPADPTTGVQSHVLFAIASSAPVAASIKLIDSCRAYWFLHACTMIF
jgi:hypothetical protein